MSILYMYVMSLYSGEVYKHLDLHVYGDLFWGQVVNKQLIKNLPEKVVEIR